MRPAAEKLAARCWARGARYSSPEAGAGAAAQRVQQEETLRKQTHSTAKDTKHMNGELGLQPPRPSATQSNTKNNKTQTKHKQNNRSDSNDWYVLARHVDAEAQAYVRGSRGHAHAHARTHARTRTRGALPAASRTPLWSRASSRESPLCTWHLRLRAKSFLVMSLSRLAYEPYSMCP